MYYDIRNVGYEFMEAERCFENQDWEGAYKHYDLAIKNYEYADNEYILPTNCSYTIDDCGQKRDFPSLTYMVNKAERRLSGLKYRKRGQESKESMESSESSELKEREGSRVAENSGKFRLKKFIADLFKKMIQ